MRDVARAASSARVVRARFAVAVAPQHQLFEQEEQQQPGEHRRPSRAASTPCSSACGQQLEKHRAEQRADREADEPRYPRGCSASVPAAATTRQHAAGKTGEDDGDDGGERETHAGPERIIRERRCQPGARCACRARPRRSRAEPDHVAMRPLCGSVAAIRMEARAFVNVQRPPPWMAVTPARRGAARERVQIGVPFSWPIVCGTKHAAAPDRAAQNAAKTSSPTSNARGPMAGPSHASTVRRRDAHRRDRGFEHAAGESAPAGMRGGDDASVAIGEQHRKAVGGQTAHTTPARRVTARVGRGGMRRRAASTFATMRAVHLRRAIPAAPGSEAASVVARDLPASRRGAAMSIDARRRAAPLRVVDKRVHARRRGPRRNDPVEARRRGERDGVELQFAGASAISARLAPRSAASSSAAKSAGSADSHCIGSRVAGMEEPEPPRVQRLAGAKRGMRATRGGGRTPGRRPADGRATRVHADLVRAAGFEPAARAACSRRSARAPRSACARACRWRRPPSSCAAPDGVRSAHRSVRRARCRRGEREIFALHACAPAAAARARSARSRLGDDQQPARVLVEAVHDARARDARQLRRVMQQRVGERAVPVAAARMHDQARRLVDRRSARRPRRRSSRAMRLRGECAVARIGQRRDDDALAAASLCFGARGAPATVTRPASIQALSRLRECCGSSCASAWSSRMPGAVPDGTVERIAAVRRIGRGTDWVIIRDATEVAGRNDVEDVRSNRGRAACVVFARCVDRAAAGYPKARTKPRAGRPSSCTRKRTARW